MPSKKEAAFAAIDVLRSTFKRYADAVEQAVMGRQKREGLQKGALARAQAEQLGIALAPLVAAIEWDANRIEDDRVDLDQLVAVAQRITKAIDDATEKLCQNFLSTEDN